MFQAAQLQSDPHVLNVFFCVESQYAKKNGKIVLLLPENAQGLRFTVGFHASD
jgi:hypothetical protein